MMSRLTYGFWPKITASATVGRTDSLKAAHWCIDIGVAQSSFNGRPWVAVAIACGRSAVGFAAHEIGCVVG